MNDIDKALETQEEPGQQWADAFGLSIAEAQEALGPELWQMATSKGAIMDSSLRWAAESRARKYQRAKQQANIWRDVRAFAYTITQWSGPSGLPPNIDRAMTHSEIIELMGDRELGELAASAAGRCLESFSNEDYHTILINISLELEQIESHCKDAGHRPGPEYPRLFRLIEDIDRGVELFLITYDVIKDYDPMSDKTINNGGPIGYWHMPWLLGKAASEREAQNKPSAQSEKKRIKKLALKDKTAYPFSPNGADQVVAMATSPYVALVNKTISNWLGVDLIQNDNQEYCLISKTNPRHQLVLVLGDTPGDSLEAMTSYPMIKSFLTDLPIQAAVLNLFFAVCVTRTSAPGEVMTFSYKDLAKLLGLERNNKTRRENMNLIISWVKVLNSFMAPVVTPGKGGAWIGSNRVWDCGHEAFFNEATQEMEDLRVECRAGLWAKHYLNTSDDEELKKVSTNQIGWIDEATLRDISKHSYQKPHITKLMLFLLFKHKNDSFKWQPVRVETLMIQAFGTERLNEANGSRAAKQTLKNSLFEALLIMHESGWGMGFDAWPDELLPDWKTDDNRSKLPDGYFDQLLNLTLLVKPRLAVAAKLDEMKIRNSERQHQRLTGRKPKRYSQAKAPQKPSAAAPEPQAQAAVSDADIGGLLKSKRKAQGLSQAEAAVIFGIGKSYVSKLERKDKAASSELAQKIRDW